MATRDEPRPSEGRNADERDDNKHRDTSHPAEPGTEGPAGYLDDQPQREDEYLSKVLKEFNPQRKDKKGTLPGTDADAEN